MNYKVHWIIDGLVDVEANSKEEAEEKIQKDLEEYVKNSKKLMNQFIAKSIQGSANIPGKDDKKNEENNT